MIRVNGPGPGVIDAFLLNLSAVPILHIFGLLYFELMSALLLTV